MTTRPDKSCKSDTGKTAAPSLEGIKQKIMVLSGKGGVGKSSVAACLALGLTKRGFRVGLMDIDFHGPSIPVIFGLEDAKITGDELGMNPVRIGDNLGVISIGFFLASRDQAVIWRGPLKMTAIRQFLEEIHWGDLDYLIVDAPPGTGDEPLSLAQLIPDACGLIVTTPQKVALADVIKSVSFCRQVGMRILGVVENMQGLVCPHCGENIDLFGPSGTGEMARNAHLDILVSLPLDTDFAAWADRAGARNGDYAEIPRTSVLMDSLVDEVINRTPAVSQAQHEAEIIRMPGNEVEAGADNNGFKEGTLRTFAIPTENGRLCAHFGHCEKFTIVEADDETQPLIRETCDAPPHEPGLLPRWLAEKGVETVIAGGMGMRAQQIFAESGVQVLCGAPEMPPLELVQRFLSGELKLGDNVCDH